MKPNEVENLAIKLQGSGIAVCEIYCHGEITLKLRFASNRLVPSTLKDSRSEGREVVEPGFIKSPGMGHFYSRHPLSDVPTASVGDRVGAGQAVGYLLANGAIFEVVAQAAGVLGKQIANDGDLVGYASLIFEFAA